jgi:glutathione reductase (NADPH)
MTRYDVLIIGSGAAGQTVAAHCAKGGMTVAVVDRLPFGGTCVLRGCVPKKVLLAAAEAIGHVGMLAGRGVEGTVRIDWPALMRRKAEFTDGVPANTRGWMNDMGIATLSGTARFVSPDSVAIGDEMVTASAIVIATGARPIDLGIEGKDAALSSTDFLSLEQLPKRVAFIGGGYVSFEFSWLAHHAGSKVTIIHRSEQALKGFDPMLADKVMERYRRMGIEVLLNAPVERIDRVPGGLSIVTPSRAIEADAVVHGAGRTPNFDGLDLQAGGVEFSRRGVTVDSHLRSVSNPGVWSAGDAAAIGAPLTPVAGAQGQVVAAGILGKPIDFMDLATPSVVFSDPPLTRVGVDVEAAENDDRLEVKSFDMDSWFTQKRVGNDTAGARLVLDRKTGAVKGAHLLGVDAGEVINIFALAMQFGITIEQLRAVTWSYPTLAYEINYLTERY